MMQAVTWLGQPAGPVVDAPAWDVYVRSIRDSMGEAFVRATAARQALKNVRERLGLPFIVNPGEGAATAGAWDDGLEQDFKELGSMVATLSRFADEALAGKRRFGTSAGGLAFERLDSDFTRVEVQGGRPVEIENATGQPVDVTGTVGAMPAIVTGIVVVAAVVAAYFAVEAVCDTVSNVAEQKTFETISNNQTRQIEQGATPEQAQALTQSIYEGAAAVHEARAAEAGAGRSEIPQTIRTVGFIALGLAAIYVVLRGRGMELTPARLLENPIRRSGGARVNIKYRDEFEDYAGVITWPGDSWRFEGLRPPRMGVQGGPPIPGRDIPVDSAKAYDIMAETALSFAAYDNEELFGVADYDFDRDKFVVRRR